MSAARQDCPHLDPFEHSLQVVEDAAAAELVERLDDETEVYEHAATWLWTEYRLTPRQVQACERTPMLARWIDDLRASDHAIWRAQVQRSTVEIMESWS